VLKNQATFFPQPDDVSPWVTPLHRPRPTLHVLVEGTLVHPISNKRPLLPHALACLAASRTFHANCRGVMIARKAKPFPLTDDGVPADKTE